MILLLSAFKQACPDWACTSGSPPCLGVCSINRGSQSIRSVHRGHSSTLSPAKRLCFNTDSPQPGTDREPMACCIRREVNALSSELTSAGST